MGIGEVGCVTHPGAKAQSLKVGKNSSVANQTRRTAYLFGKLPKWKRCMMASNTNTSRDFYLHIGKSRKKGYVDRDAEAAKSALRTLDLLRQIIACPIPRPAKGFNQGAIQSLLKMKRIAPSADGKLWCATDEGRDLLLKVDKLPSP